MKDSKKFTIHLKVKLKAAFSKFMTLYYVILVSYACVIIISFLLSEPNYNTKSDLNNIYSDTFIIKT